MSEALAPGTRLGPYEIEGLIGSGGMGEVYRAREPRLRQHVATHQAGRLRRGLTSDFAAS